MQKHTSTKVHCSGVDVALFLAWKYFASPDVWLCQMPCLAAVSGSVGQQKCRFNQGAGAISDSAV